MLIRRITEDDLEGVWTLRLAAIAESPEAFGSTLQETMARGPGSWLERLRQGGERLFYLGAYDESLIGMTGFMREQGSKEQHKGTVITLYVVPERRRQGVGRALMVELIARAQRLDGLEQLHLAVVTTERAATNLYRSLGFQTYGTAPRALKVGDRYLDEALMLLQLPLPVRE